MPAYLLINCLDKGSRIPGQVVAIRADAQRGKAEQPPAFRQVVVEDAEPAELQHLLASRVTNHPQTETEAFLGLVYPASRIRRQVHLVSVPADGARVRKVDLITAAYNRQPTVTEKPDNARDIRFRLCGLALENGASVDEALKASPEQLLRLAKGE